MNPFYSNLSFKKSLTIIDLFLINIFQTFVRKILTPNTAVFCITLLSRATWQIQPKIYILNILPHTRAPKAHPGPISVYDMTQVKLNCTPDQNG